MSGKRKRTNRYAPDERPHAMTSDEVAGIRDMGGIGDMGEKRLHGAKRPHGASRAVRSPRQEVTVTSRPFLVDMGTRGVRMWAW